MLSVGSVFIFRYGHDVKVTVDMDIVAEIREIYHMICSKMNLKARYNYWNNRVFDGKLPDIPVTWFRSKRLGGVTKGQVNRRDGTGKVNSIRVSDYIQDEDVLDGVLLHEMIHAEMFMRGQGGHGFAFDALRSKYSAKTGVKIPRAVDMSSFVVPESVDIGFKGVMTYKAAGQYGMVVYNMKFFERALPLIQAKAKQYAEYYAHRGMESVVFVMVSKYRDLGRYPEKRSIMRGAYQINQAFYNNVMSEGEVISRYVS
jgi:hypothetical protein